MSFNVNEFISHLDQNNMVAHANMFNVNITVPTGLASGGYGMRELQLTCESAELPGVDITPIEYRHYAFAKRIPHHFNFSPLSLTFYCTGTMMEKRFFDAWMNLCISKDSGLINYRLDNNGNPQYESDITISQFDTAGHVTYFAQAFECMPISVSPLNTNWADDSVHRVNVQFLFTKWKNLDEGAFNQSPNANNPGIPFVSNFTNILGNIEKTLTNPNELLSPRGVSNVIGGVESQVGKAISNPFELI